MEAPMSTYVDWTSMEPVHTGNGRKLSEEAFVQECADRVGTTPEHVREWHRIVPCECGEAGCPGWRAVWKSAAQRA